MVASTGRKKYTSVAKIADAVQFNKGIVVSRTTVDEDLIAMGYSSKARRKQCCGAYSREDAQAGPVRPLPSIGGGALLGRVLLR
jgi:hypothetical protein